MTSRNHGSKTPKDEIIAYWELLVCEDELAVDWSDAKEFCWRCGHKSHALERCHIVPHSLGGGDTPANLVLLCGRCHRENPNTDDPDFFWQWLRAARKLSCYGFYDTYWVMRGFEEFRKIFSREPFSELDPNLTMDVIQTTVKPLMNRVAKHFGDNGLNPATWAWILYQAEQLLSSEPLRKGLLFDN